MRMSVRLGYVFRDIDGHGGGRVLWYPFLVVALMREPFCESRN